MRHRYGRAPEGESPEIRVAAIRSANHSMAAAMAEDGIIVFKVLKGAYNQERFSQFLFELFQALSDKGKGNCHLVMDNVGFHKTREVQALIRAHGHTPCFLPAYSPELNPIEEVFSQWKRLVKSAKPTDARQLMVEIETAGQRITPENCRNYYDSMLHYVSGYMAQDAMSQML